MNLFLNLTASGLVIGSVYGLLAMGFNIIYRATGMLNFAQGEVMLIVAYAAYSLGSILQAPLPLLILACLTAGMGTGLLMERLFIRPMAAESVFAKVMVTIALAIMIRALIAIIWGNNPLPMPQLLGVALFSIGPISLYTTQIVVIGLLALTALATWLLFTYTRSGIAMRAAANDEPAALLSGIDTNRVQAAAWSISGLYSALAGLACALLFNVEPAMSMVAFRAFPAAILGGLDSVLGASLGGLIIGVLENYAGGYLGRGMKDIVGFLMIIVILMIRPYGLFGTARIERV